jgi:hypothetical protein
MPNERDRYTNPERYAETRMREQAAETAALAEHVRKRGRGGTRAELLAEMQGTGATAQAPGARSKPTVKRTREPWEHEGPAAAEIREKHPELIAKAREVARARRGTTVEAVCSAFIAVIEDGRREEFETRTQPLARMLRYLWGRTRDRSRVFDAYGDGLDAEQFTRAGLTPEEIRAIDKAGITAVEALARVDAMDDTDGEAARYAQMTGVEYVIYNRKLEDK